MNLPKHIILHAAFLAVLTLPASAVVSIDWVTIGNPGNAAQSAANRTHSFGSGGDGRGAVADTFWMSRNETTIAQYAEFLNAKAASDPYDLWNPNMASQSEIAGITRSGSSGSYTYSVTGSGLRPITYVSWFDVARFANWMQNSQGSGDTENGAYTLVGGQTSGNAPAKNVGATVWIPTQNEWFQAAYYDPTHMSGAGGYWLHANQSNSMTNNSPLVAGAANYYDGDYAVTQSGIYSSSQNYLTDAGAYGSDSQNYYGLNDMAGNVWEWNDLNAQSGSERQLRGGAWNFNGSIYTGDGSLRSSFSYGTSPSDEGGGVNGFRLASAIPEPSSLENG